MPTAYAFQAPAQASLPGLRARLMPERAFAFRSGVSLLEGAPKSWVQMAIPGAWDGHPSGPFEFNASAFADIIANFERQANPVPVTYEHPDKWTGQPVPAAGWVTELAVRDDALWGLVEWTPRAADMIRSGEYRFCSVVVDFDSKARDTGAPTGVELYELGLTNTPFLDGMKPITLSRRASPTESNMSKKTELKKPTQADAAQSTLDDVAAALDMDTSDPSEIEKRVKALVAFIEAMSPKAAPPADDGSAPADDAAASEMPADMKAASALGSDARKAWLAKLGEANKTFARVAKLMATDGTGAVSGTEDQASPGGGTTVDPDGDQAVDDALASVLDAAGMTIADFAAWLKGNSAELVALLTGGGAPAEMGDPPAAPAEMSRAVAALKLELSAKGGEVKRLAAEVEAFKAADAKRAADALVADRDGLIKAAREDGRITTDATAAAVLDIFTKDGHEAGKRALALLSPVVPTGGVTPSAVQLARGERMPLPDARGAESDELRPQGDPDSEAYKTEVLILSRNPDRDRALVALRIFRDSHASAAS